MRTDKRAWINSIPNIFSTESHWVNLKFQFTMKNNMHLFENERVNFQMPHDIFTI